MPTEPKTTMCYLLQSDIIISPLKTLHLYYLLHILSVDLRK